jgi:hypothetical protein
MKRYSTKVSFSFELYLNPYRCLIFYRFNVVLFTRTSYIAIQKYLPLRSLSRVKPFGELRKRSQQLHVGQFALTMARYSWLQNT